MTEESKEVATTEGAINKALAAYAPFSADIEEIREIVEANLGNGGVGQFDLDRVKIPSSGGRIWEIPTLDGSPEAAGAIEGIIVGYRDGRVYWSRSIDEGSSNQPPDCASQDSVRGRGTRWPNDEQGEHSCDECPYSRFESASRGHGQACKQVRALFVLRPDSLMPLVIQLPPTSLKGCRQYLLRLTSARVPYYGVVSRITLAAAKNRDGIAYSQAAFSLVSRLAPAEMERVKAYTQTIGGMMTRAAIEVAATASNDAE